MDELTDLFGDRLHDPQARIELQAALAVALPSWQDQAGGEPAQPPVPGPIRAGANGQAMPPGLPPGLGPGSGDSGPALPGASAAGRSFYPVVAVDHVLHEAVLGLPGVRSTGESGEVLVPVTIGPQGLTNAEGSVLVYGPAAPVETIGESLQLTRRAADLLARRQVTGEEMGGVVPVSDLTGLLIAEGAPLLTQLAVERQLEVLNGLEAPSRLHLAEVLLEWLLTGESVLRIAERAGVPGQTMHSRLKRARSLLGEEVLNDPYQRLELTIALHHMVPLWREQAGE